MEFKEELINKFKKIYEFVIDYLDERIAKNRLEREIYKEKTMQERIRKRFLEVFALLKDSENVKIVDASRSIGEVSGDIIKIYNEFKGEV